MNNTANIYEICMTIWTSNSSSNVGIDVKCQPARTLHNEALQQPTNQSSKQTPII